MNRIRQWFGLERNIVAMLLTILLVGMGEELWSRFLPKYLQLLGAGAWTIAVYGALKDLLDSLYQYPGGWLADRFGRRWALICSSALAIAGYLIYLIAGSATWIIIGTVLVMAWSSLSLPALFAIVGDNLPKTKRATGFGVQSFLKRIPIMLAPPIGGWIIATAGFQSGIRFALVITVALALLSIVILRRYYSEACELQPISGNVGRLWQSFDPALKRLLLADCLARWAEGIPKVFIVLYVIDVLHVSPIHFGWLISIQTLASMLSYIPGAKLSDHLNRKPFVLTTFGFFAFFPVVLAAATSEPLLVIAFIVAGLREFGEPARKALIVDLAVPTATARSVGTYYLIRQFVVFPAPIVGGWLWTMEPTLPFYIAFAAGIIGCVIYATMGKETRQSDQLQPSATTQ
jgi:MFS family permease